MSFGTSVGDIILALRLASHVRSTYKNSPTVLLSLTAEISLLEQHLHSPRLPAPLRQELQTVLTELKALKRGYERKGKGMKGWLCFGGMCFEDMTEVRVKVINARQSAVAWETMEVKEAMGRVLEILERGQAEKESVDSGFGELVEMGDSTPLVGGDGLRATLWDPPNTMAMPRSRNAILATEPARYQLPQSTPSQSSIQHSGPPQPTPTMPFSLPAPPRITASRPIKPSDDRTPLLIFLLNLPSTPTAKSLSRLRKLLAKGANQQQLYTEPSLNQGVYQSALHYAAYRGWVEVLGLLHEMGGLLSPMDGVLEVARGGAEKWVRANGGCCYNRRRCAKCNPRRERAVWDGVDSRYEMG